MKSLVSCCSFVVLMFLVSCGSQTHEEYLCAIEGNECDKTDKRGDNEGRSENGENTQVIVGPAGPQGEKGDTGAPGATGAQGEAGQGCSVTQALNGALIECASGSVLVLNGQNGEDGQDGEDGMDGQDGQDGADAPPTPYSVSEVIDPCGAESNFDEVLLKLANGAVVASFSENANGLNTRFVIIGPGNYMTTDGTSCQFTVNQDLTVSW